MIFSNTEITTYNTCRMQHYYAYELGLEPVEPSVPLYRGQLGHSALETYYSLLQGGLSVEEATEGAIFVVDGELTRIAEEEPWNSKKLLEATQIRLRILQYSQQYPSEPFEVVSVEQKYKTDVTGELSFGFIPDLIVTMTKGPKRGQMGLIDHKFQYNWKTVEENMLDGQLAKYRKALRLNDLPVQWIMFNQIRTRDMNYKTISDMYRRDYGLVNEIAGDIMWSEQAETMQDIVEKTGPPRRALAPMVCKPCPFKQPCMLSLGGMDVKKILEMEFKPRQRPLKEWFDD